MRLQDTVKVKILGQEYEVKARGGEEYVQALSRYVDKKVSEVQKSGSAVSTMELVALVMLNMADEIAQISAESEKLKKKADKQVKHLIELIEKKEKT